MSTIPSAAPSSTEGQRPPRRENRGPREVPKSFDEHGNELVEKIVFINRCAKVVKGGRRFSFSAICVVGDRKGRVGVGYGKANEVPDAIKKSTENAKKNFVTVKLKGDTIPHDVMGIADGGKVLLKPASTGTGLIAGGAVRAVLELAGLKNIYSKVYGSRAPINMVRATVQALGQIKTYAEIKALRGK